MKMRKISEGAEAHIYSMKFLGFDSIVKRRIEKKYRLKEIDENIRTQRTKNEARILALVKDLGIDSPGLLLVDKYDIYMQRINGIRLNELLNSDNKNLAKVFADLGKYAAILHANNIAHGDYTPANVIVGNGRVYLIDFGLSEITNSLEEKALDLLLMKRSIDKNLFDKFIGNYKHINKESCATIKRLAEIEKRGRYNTRTLIIK